MKPRTMRPRKWMSEALAIVLAAAMPIIQGMEILVILKKPAQRQKKTPTAVAAMVVSVWEEPFSVKEMKLRTGAAKARPPAQAMAVHSNEEKFEP